MLETAENSKLATWRLPQWPPDPNDIFTPLGDHRREYLDFEGAVSGNQGQVKRVASGKIESIESTPEGLIVTLPHNMRIILPKLR